MDLTAAEQGSMEPEHRLFMECLEISARDDKVVGAFNQANGTQLSAAVVRQLITRDIHPVHGAEITAQQCEDTFRFIVFVYGHIFRRYLFACRRNPKAKIVALRAARERPEILRDATASACGLSADAAMLSDSNRSSSGTRQNSGNAESSLDRSGARWHAQPSVWLPPISKLISRLRHRNR